MQSYTQLLVGERTTKNSEMTNVLYARRAVLFQSVERDDLNARKNPWSVHAGEAGATFPSRA